MRIPQGLRAAAGIPTGGNPWDVASASFNGTPINSYYLGYQSLSVFNGLFIKPDGTKIYGITLNSVVYEYNLSTAWDVTTASYVQNRSVAAQDNQSLDVFFKNDGTSMYTMGNSNDSVYEYSLSTAWDISTASYVRSFSVTAQETLPTSLFFKPDGTKMYVLGDIGNDVNEYNLSTAWNISTASYVQTFSVNAEETSPQGLFFKDDGTKMYVTGGAGDDVNEYNLSTAWNISTASYVQAFSVAEQEETPNGVFFKDDGTKMYIIGFTQNVYQYSLSTAWDVSTASYSNPSSDYLFVRSQESIPTDIHFKPDGTKMYIIGSVGASVFEYNLSTAWSISTASYFQDRSVAAQDNTPESLFFKPDGTKMYVLGRSANAVYEYNLSTAWNVSTTSYVQSFSVAAQESQSLGLFFKSDGTKMYVVGSNGDDVNEYNLSTAWNISTASYVQVFSVAAQETNPSCVFFKDDGTKMYVTGLIGSNVNEYSLSTAWNVSTASYAQAFSVAAQDRQPSGLFFKDDGTKLYIIGRLRDSIWSYDL